MNHIFCRNLDRYGYLVLLLPILKGIGPFVEDNTIKNITRYISLDIHSSYRSFTKRISWKSLEYHRGYPIFNYALDPLENRAAIDKFVVSSLPHSENSLYYFTIYPIYFALDFINVILGNVFCFILWRNWFDLCAVKCKVINLS